MKNKLLKLIPLTALIFAGCSPTNTPVTPDPKPVDPTPVVTDPKVISVSITNAPTSSIELGQEITLSVNVEVKDGASNAVTWSSSDTDVATVTDGKVKALSEGTTKISAVSTFDSTKKDEVTITISSKPAEKNIEKETFDEIVSNLKNSHNYTLHMHSQFDDETDEEEIMDGEYYNINDKAWFNTLGYFPYSGIILQKDQGYLYFDSLGTDIIDDGFVSTNTSKGVSEIWSLVGENLFYDSYEQDSSDKTKFVTKGANNTNIAVAANFTQYADYIKTSQFSVDENGMTAVIDVTNKTITLTLKWKIWYFDETEHQDPGTIVITVKDVGSTHNKAIEDFVENPTIVYTKPTTWPSESAEVFKERFNGYTPVFPTNASYAFNFEDKLYDGFYYATVIDYASGNMTSSYGAQLENDGFTKSSDTRYVKNISEGTSTMKVSYVATMTYVEPTIQFPSGVMYIRYRATKTTGTFDSISDFNTYLTTNKYNEIFPLLPEESTCTGISNFKDNTATSTDYALKFNGTDWINVKIADYSKALAWRTAFAEACVAKGFSDAQTGGSLFDSYGYKNSTTGSVICIAAISQSSYSGIVQFRASVTNVDAEDMRKPASELDYISLSGMTTEYTVGDSFSFDGVCTAHFTGGETMEVTPTSVSTPSMNTVGQKDVTVSYTANDITKTASYQINVSAKQYAPISVVADTHVLSYVVKDAENDVEITTFNPANYGFRVIVELEDGYTVTGVTVDNDSSVYAGYVKEEKAIYVYPSEYELDEYVVRITTGPATPEPTKYTLSKSNDSGCQIKMVNPSTSGSSWQVAAGEDVTFWVKPFSGYEVTSFGIENHPEIQFTTAEVSGHTEYTFKMPEHDCKIVATSSPVTPSVTYSISTPTLTGGEIYNVQPGTSDIEEGQQIRFTVKAAEGYAYVADSVSVKDAGGNTVTCTLSPMSQSTYIFTMPASDVTITAEFESTAATTYSATKEVNDTNGGTVAFISSSSDLSEGDTVTLSVKVNDGYELDSISIKNHPEIEITKGSTNPLTGATQYSFEMPAEDVVVLVNFKTKGGETDPIIALLAATTFEGTCDDSNNANVVFDFNEDGTGTASFSSGTGFLAKSYVQSFKYSVTNKGSGQYEIAFSDIAKVSGAATGLSMNLSNAKSFTFTSNGTSISSATYVAYSTMYETTYTTTFTF